MSWVVSCMGKLCHGWMQGCACASPKQQAVAWGKVSSAFCCLPAASSWSSWVPGRQAGSPACPGIPRNVAFHMIQSSTQQPCLQVCSWRSGQGWSGGQTLAGRRDIPWRETPCVSLRRELANASFTGSCYCHLQFVSSEGQTACLWCTYSCKTSELLCYFPVCVYICTAWIHCSCLKKNPC